MSSGMNFEPIEPESSRVNMRFGLTAVGDDVLRGDVAMSVLAAKILVPATSRTMPIPIVRASSEPRL
jgi:hypothetical protein